MVFSACCVMVVIMDGAISSIVLVGVSMVGLAMMPESFSLSCVIIV